MKKLLALSIGLFMAAQAFSQVTKADVQALIDSHPFTGKEMVLMGTKSESSWTFEQAYSECKITLRESGILLAWSSGAEFSNFIVPYSEIRHVRMRNNDAGEIFFTILTKE